MMNNQKFIPELHDIGKLVDEKAKEEVKNKIGKAWSGHVFVDFDFQKFGISQPTSPSWWGQYHHKIENNKDINDWDAIPQKFRLSLFLLILADHLASSVSRATLERYPGIPKLMPKNVGLKEGIYKLWNKNFYRKMEEKEKFWAAFKTTDDLKILFNEIENCQSGEEFLDKYRDYLLLTPEDKSVPRNITSLYTHVELVGKIYRVLEKNARLITEPNGTIVIEYNGEKVKTIKEAEGGKRTTGNTNIDKGKWQARLIKCWIKFPHSFVRLRDINLLRKREELVNCITSYYKDEVVFVTSDFITLFLPPDQDLKEILKPLLDWGFYIEVEETLADLGILNSILDRKTLRARKCVEEFEKREDCKKKPKEEFENQLNVLNSRDTKVYRRYLMSEIPDEIQPHICDICQQRRGIERIKETIREWVCEKCQEIRDMGEPFREYATVWEEEGVKVCWFKFSLDQKKLEDWLQNAFGEYVDKIIRKRKNERKNIKEEINRRISIKTNKENEKNKLIEEAKKLSDKEKKKTIGQKIKEISDEIKGIKFDIGKLENEKNNLRNEINELELSKVNFRPLALQVDFNKDYKEMLKEFWNEFDGIEDIKKPIAEYDELGVFKYSPELTKMVIEKFLDLFKQYFPNCASDNSSPISLSLSIANIKYPIREHWGFFERSNKNFFNVRYYRVFEDTYTKDELENIFEIVEKAINVKTSSYFLHKLAQLEESLQSEIHITVEIFNNRKKNPEIYNLFSKGIKPSKLLNLYKLLGGGDNEIT